MVLIVEKMVSEGLPQEAVIEIRCSTWLSWDVHRAEVQSMRSNGRYRLEKTFRMKLREHAIRISRGEI